jgi:hypothetical protein
LIIHLFFDSYVGNNFEYMFLNLKEKHTYRAGLPNLQIDSMKGKGISGRRGRARIKKVILYFKVIGSHVPEPAHCYLSP